jgi:uncharacterized RDD family membrane protein YckC
MRMSEQITITSAGGVEVKLDLVALGGRSYAFVLDWHFRLLFALAWFLFALVSITGSFTLDDPELITDLGSLFFYLVILPPFLIYFLYHPVLEIAMHGRTPGKRMAGIRIVAKDGSSASSGAILLRNIFRLIDSLPTFYVLGILVCLFNKQHLRIGDIAAGTVLIYEEKASKKRLNLIMDGNAGHRLSTRQRELVAELLDRWKELAAVTRKKLAIELLTKFGQAMATDSTQQTDTQLRDRLQQLLK